MSSIDTSGDAPRSLGPARPGLLILCLAVFSGVTTETLPIALLPAVAATFGVTEATSGLLVTLYAALVAALAVPLTVLTRGAPRKLLLILATGCLLASNVLAAVAPTFAVLAAARGLGGAAHAVFFSVAIGYAARLVPPDQTGRALALASAGIPAGFVIGVPLATTLGTAVGWRGSFLALAALMAIVLLLVVVRLPAVTAAALVYGPRARVGSRLHLVPVVVANTLVYLGHYALYTFVSVLLLRSGAVPSTVGPILMIFGAISLVGLWIAGTRLDAYPRASALVTLLVLALGMAATGVGYPMLAVVIVAAAVWNGAFGPVASLFQSAAVRTRAVSPEVAGAWIVSTSNIGIAGGAASGGAILQHAGVAGIAWFGAAVITAAVVVVAASTSAFSRRPASAR